MAPAFFSCEGGDDGGGPCTDPIRDYPFAASSSIWLLKPLKVGDTMIFKVCYRADRSSNYVYRKDENFIIKDTILKKIQTWNTQTYNCNDQMIIHTLFADITGPESFTCQLSSDGVFGIGLRGKTFNKSSDQYLNHQSEWDDSLFIGGKEYYSVTRCKGLNPGQPSYTDSSYMFYNQEYGILKFIINDTLIYQRYLH